MRCSELALLAALAGCALRLGGDDPDARVPDGGPAVPVAVGCRPFANLAVVGGGLRSVAEPDGSTLVIADGARVAGAEIPSLALIVPASASLDDCLATAAFAGGAPASALPSGASLGSVLVGGVPWLFTSDPSGVGVATQTAPGRFAPSRPLWTADRPGYGAGAVRSGADVYVVGCRPARFLDADCYVARAPSAGLADESAYGYYVGGGNWSPRADDAWPVTPAGTSVDIAWSPAVDRWLLVFVPPLGDTIRVRSGLRPEGPWSAPVDLARCDLADPDMFCVGLAVHPTLAAPAGAIVVGYVPASFAADQAARRAAEPDKWWPRLAAVRLPSLP
jgi:hypothetical protein